MIKRIWGNLKWLFGNPPTSLRLDNDCPPCNYCGAENNLWHVDGGYCICANCQKKVYDQILLSKKENDSEDSNCN